MTNPTSKWLIMMEGRVRVRKSRRNLESYLFDDEVLERLAKSVGKDDKGAELSAKKKSIRESRPSDPTDDLKPSSGQIYLACKQTLSLAQPGNDTKTFMRDTLAPLIEPGMKVYEDLKPTFSALLVAMPASEGMK